MTKWDTIQADVADQYAHLDEEEALMEWLGAIYLPWHTIATAVFITVAYKIYKVRRDKW
jgi:hypothetical protein